MLKTLRTGLLAALCALAACQQKDAGKTGAGEPPFDYQEADLQTTPEGLKYVIVEEGDGPKPQPGDKVTAHYQGRLENDTIFDSSYERGEPIDFVMGRGQVIPGWEKGFALLKEGAKAVLIIPPDLGYGSNPTGPIPANSTLYFHVELVKTEAQKDYSFEYDKERLQTAPSGLMYARVEEGDGPKPAKGDVISVHIHGKKADGSVFNSTYEGGKPLQTGLGQTGIPGLNEAIAMTSAGGKTVALVPPALGPGPNGARMGISPDDTLEFHIEVLDLKSFAVKHQPPFQYDESNAKTTQSGLKYVIVEEGKGPKPQQGEQINVHYHGLLADGTKFDSSYERGQPFQTQAGTGQVIRGWNEAFPLLNKGTRAVLIIPPELGYGPQGQGGIPPNATLYFHVKLYE